MKSIPWTYGIVGALALSAVALAGVPRPAIAEPGGQAAERLASCDHYMGAYARSSARKLSRSLTGQKYSLSTLPQESSIEAGTAGGDEQTDHQFELLFVGERTAAGVIEKTRTHRTTYVVVHYELGPIVTTHRWPSREAIASGKEECKPVASNVGFPAVPVAEVDVDPFKFWGLRIVWHIPTDLPDEAVETAPLDALKAIIAASD
jgi:hypothetical protein